MKKILTTILAFWLMANIASAQVQSLAGINYFYSMNTVGCDTTGIDKMTSMQPGYGFGVVYKHTELAGIIGLQAEANYEYQGFRIEPNDDLYYERHFKYLTVPLYAHVDIGKHAVKTIFAIGTYGSFLLDKEAIKTNIQDWDTSSVRRIHQGRYKTFTYGLCGQLGLAFCTKAGVFEIMGRAQIGMSKMVDMGELRLFNYVSGRSFAVGASYLVPFGNGDKYWTKRERIRKEKAEDSVTNEPISDEANDEEANDAQPESSNENPETPTQEEEESWEERM